MKLSGQYSTTTGSDQNLICEIILKKSIDKGDYRNPKKMLNIVGNVYDDRNFTVKK
jgi:hypothetical protein